MEYLRTQLYSKVTDITVLITIFRKKKSCQIFPTVTGPGHLLLQARSNTTHNPAGGIRSVLRTSPSEELPMTTLSSHSCFKGTLSSQKW